MIALLVIMAFFLRIVGINFGLPAVYHQDEPIIVNHAMAIGVSGWNPHFFVLPPFTFYFLFTQYALFFIVGRLAGFFPTAAAFGIEFLKDPTVFYLIGRVTIGVLFGTATIFLVFRFGERFFSRRVGLLAAFFLALAPAHVQHSHYIYTDIPLTFALMALLYQLTKLASDHSYHRYAVIGVLLGWAVSIKYTAILALPSAFLAHILVWKQKFFSAESLQKIFLATFCCLGVFILLAPYTFFDWAEFHRQIVLQAGAEFFVGWWHHLVYSIAQGTSYTLVALAGLGMAGWIFFRKAPGLILVSFFMVYYLVSTLFGQPFSRYLLPVIPAVCLAAACGWLMLCERIQHRSIRMALLLVVVGSLLVPALQLDKLFLSRDTRSDCAEWVHEHVLPNAVIILDNRFFGPPLKQNAEQVRDKYALLGDAAADPARKKRLDLLLQAMKDEPSYTLYYLKELGNKQQGNFLFQGPLVEASLEEFKRIGAEYLVINYTEYSQEIHEFKDSIITHLELVASFSPFKDLFQKIPFDQYASTAAPQAVSDLFSRVRLGPYLEVYRIKRS